MTHRQRLANRRASETVSFRHDGIKCHATFSRFPDGRLAEIFLNGGKVGSALQAVLRDTAVVLSIALQNGTPLDEIRDALTAEDDGRPAGPLGAALDAIEAGGGRMEAAE